MDDLFDPVVSLIPSVKEEDDPSTSPLVNDESSYDEKVEGQTTKETEEEKLDHVDNDTDDAKEGSEEHANDGTDGEEEVEDTEDKGADADNTEDETQDEEGSDKEIEIDTLAKKSDLRTDQVAKLSDSSTVRELKDMCKSMGLSTYGKKTNLAMRIIESKADEALLVDTTTH